jgi:Holliday junction resolvasome RuvABC endonuclease subunit
VGEAMSTVMGIDLGIAKVAYSLWRDGVLVETHAMESHHPLRTIQLLELSDDIYEAGKFTGPDYVFIEDVLIGNNRKYSLQLAQSLGAVLSSLGLLSLEQPLDVHLVNVSTWKKDVVGSGNASKEDVRNYIHEIHSAYAVSCGSDQDRYDAACIGYYGHLIADRAEALLEAVRSVPRSAG